MKIKAGIIGGAGYTGGELTRLLINHPAVDISFIHSRSNAGNPVSSIHTDLEGETNISFSSEVDYNIDVLFLCVGHGEGRKFIESNDIPDTVRVIDLSQDFRLNPNATTGNRKFIYGLPELNKAAIASAKNIANPGCFATAIQLGLLPLAAQNELTEVHATGITGSTGAGQGLSPTSHFSWRANNIQAYKVLTHQHLKEISQSLQQLQPKETKLNFVPWRGDFTRGIFISSMVHTTKPLEEINALYKEFYKDHPFTVVSFNDISLKQVVNTNKCILQIQKEADTLVIHSAIDNLLKGASGQAVQNMNIMFGIDETTGLHLKAAAF